MKLPLRRTSLHREVPFSFRCMKCGQCCRNKKIQVNPYEVTRLAHILRMSTAAFIGCYTRDNGTVLDCKKDGTCVFLSVLGCGVHAARPLVCRLYPLGRHVFTTGQESFSEIAPDVKCKGVYGEDGWIASYLKLQGTFPFMEAADQYLGLLSRLCRILDEEAKDPDKRDVVQYVLQKSVDEDGVSDIGLADVDAIVEAFCEKLHVPVPQNVNGKISMHIRAVEAWANSTRRRAKHEDKIAKRMDGKRSGKKTSAKGH